ncbi:MAG: hypothetical protein ACXAC5_03810 [Promethearchaeota archaeon]|jgi:hypothetical protein
MRKARLENWQEVQLFGRTCLVGNVHECEVTDEGEKVFEEGEEMISSEVVHYHDMMGQVVAETKSGSRYHLGVPKKDQETLTEIMGKYAPKPKNLS